MRKTLIGIVTVLLLGAIPVSAQYISGGGSVGGSGSGVPGGSLNTVQYNAGSGNFGGAGPGTTTTLLHGNASGAPSYGAVNLGTDVTSTLPVANGGTGTASPGLVAGTNVTITGSWPNQTVNSSGSGGSTTVAPGTGVTINGSTSSSCTTTCTVATTVANRSVASGGITIGAGDLAGQVNSTDASAQTFTQPSTGTAGAGQSWMMTNQGAGVDPMSGGQTLNGLASSNLYQYGWASCTGNGTTADCFGWPGYGALSGDISATAAGAVTVNKIGGTAITLGTLTNGDLCTYTSSGTVLNCNTATSGSGVTFTDGTHTVSNATQLTVTGGTVGGTTPNATLTVSGGGSGSMVLIATRTASNSTALQFGEGQTEGSLGSSYNSYFLDCNGLKPGTAGAYIYVQVGEDNSGSVAYKTSNYKSAVEYFLEDNTASSTFTGGSVTAASNVGIFPIFALGTSNTGQFKSYLNLQTGEIYRKADFSGEMFNGSDSYTTKGGGVYTGDQTAITGLQVVVYSALNGTQETGASAFVSGQCSLYGITP